MGGMGTAAQSLGSLFSTATLASYTTLYTEPDEALSAIVERLAQDAVAEGAKAEAVLLLAFGLWRVRGRLLAPRVVA